MIDALVFITIIGIVCGVIINASSSDLHDESTGSDEVLDILLQWDVPSPANESLTIPLSERLVWEMNNGIITIDIEGLMIKGVGYLMGRPYGWDITMTGSGEMLVLGDERPEDDSLRIVSRDLGGGVTISLCTWSLD